MRILVLAPQPFFQNRGTPIAVRMLAEDLCKAGHNVDLLTFFEGEDVDLRDVRHLRIPPIPFIKNIGPGFSLKKYCVIVFCSGRPYHLFEKKNMMFFMLLRNQHLLPFVYGRFITFPMYMMSIPG